MSLLAGIACWRCFEDFRIGSGGFFSFLIGLVLPRVEVCGILSVVRLGPGAGGKGLRLCCGFAGRLAFFSFPAIMILLS